jgi:hypothetical protein
LRNIEKVDNLHIGNGLIVDIVYRVKTKIYDVESTNSKVKAAKEDWENNSEGKYDDRYYRFIELLEEALQNDK